MPESGSKHHILTCGNGLPLAVALSGANINDHLMPPELLDRVRPLRGRTGRPRHRIKALIADKGYDYPRVYAELHQRRITGYIPRRGTHDKVTGRWIVEQSLAPAAPVPPPGHPLGTTHRHPPRTPRPRRRPHLLAKAPQPNLIGALSTSPMRNYRAGLRRRSRPRSARGR
ncbi:transposase [Nocardia sp. NPDC004573]